MKLEEDMIVNGNSMNGEKIHTSTRYMQNFSKMKFAMGSFNNCMTNVTNPHTCTTSSVDLILAAVFLLHGYLLELIGDVVCGPTIGVPICINAVGPISSRNNLVIILGVIIIILIPVLAIFCCVARFPADLAPWSVGTRPVAAATTATTTPAARALRRGATVVAAAARSPLVAGSAA